MLKSAIAANKQTKSKFLVIVADSKNTAAKADFDAFIKDQETQIANYMYDAYNPEYDLYNYYFAIAKTSPLPFTTTTAGSLILFVLSHFLSSAVAK